jgi:uncharacterized protein YeaO (DUF488 family)
VALYLKRVYQPASPADGARYLVERLWPRGIRRASLKLDAWLKDVAPSDGLRRWFSHDPEKWMEFRRKYFSELRNHQEAWGEILRTARQRKVTLLFSSHDTQHNNAVALKEFLEARSTEKSAGRPQKARQQARHPRRGSDSKGHTPKSKP